MTADARFRVSALGAVIALIARLKVLPFIALVVVSLGMGLAAGMPFARAIKAFQDGVGAALGFIAVVGGLGTMLAS